MSKCRFTVVKAKKSGQPSKPIRVQGSCLLEEPASKKINDSQLFLLMYINYMYNCKMYN